MFDRLRAALQRKPKPNEYGDVTFISAQEARDRMTIQFKINALAKYNPLVIQHAISTATRDIKYSAVIKIPETELGPLLMPKEIQDRLLSLGYSVKVSQTHDYYHISWRPF